MKKKNKIIQKRVYNNEKKIYKKIKLLLSVITKLC